MKRLAVLVAAIAVVAVAGVSATSHALSSAASATVLTASTARLHADIRCSARHGCRYYFRWRTGRGVYRISEVRRTHHRGESVHGLSIAGLRRHTRYAFSVCIARPHGPFQCFGPPGRAQGNFVSAACNRYASPAGSDRHSGTVIAPLQSMGRLDRRLAPGQTGCLEAGSYGNIHTQHNLTQAGTATGQITITSAPGQTAHITGLITVEAPYTTLSGLNIDGSNNLYTSQRAGTNCPYPVSNGLEIDGRGDIFENNNLYQATPSLRGNGIGIGWNTPADNAIIRNNRIHDLGQCKAFDQMIYLAHGTGVQIYNNWMWNDHHGWGVQIYPSASGAHVHDNVIDSAGSGFVLGGGPAVHDNRIDHNVVLAPTALPDAGLRRGVGISTSGSVGPNNSFTDNSVSAAPGGVAAAPDIVVARNRTVAPKFVNPAAHDYAIAHQARRARVLVANFAMH